MELKEKFEFLKDIKLIDENILFETSLENDPLNPLNYSLLKSGKLIKIDLMDTVFDHNKDIINQYFEFYYYLTQFCNEISFENFEIDCFDEIDIQMGKIKKILIKINLFNKDYHKELFYHKYIKIHSGFFKFINRLLAEIGSKYRFFSLYYYKKDTNGFSVNCIDDNKLGIVFLTENEYISLKKEKIFYLDENEFGIIKTSEVEHLLLEYEKIGLFDSLESNFLEQEKKNIISEEFYSKKSVISYFENTLVCILPLENDCFENPYELILNNLFKISKGKFKPENIKDSYEYNKESELSFVFCDKEYKIILNNSFTYIDPISLVQFINKSLSDNGIEEQFHSIDSVEIDTLIQVIFLNEYQYQYIQENDLFLVL